MAKEYKKYLKQIAQHRLQDTDVNNAYNSVLGVITVLNNVIICNTSAAEATFQMCIDIDGSVHDESTAIHWDQPVPAHTTVTLEKLIYMYQNKAGTISLKASIANALTFTFNGEEYV